MTNHADWPIFEASLQRKEGQRLLVERLREALQAVVDAQHPVAGEGPGVWLERYDAAIAALSALLEETQ